LDDRRLELNELVRLLKELDAKINNENSDQRSCNERDEFLENMLLIIVISLLRKG